MLFSRESTSSGNYSFDCFDVRENQDTSVQKGFAFPSEKTQILGTRKVINLSAGKKKKKKKSAASESLQLVFLFLFPSKIHFCNILVSIFFSLASLVCVLMFIDLGFLSFCGVI